MTDEMPPANDAHVEFNTTPTYTELVARLMELCGLETTKDVYEWGVTLLAAAASAAAKGQNIGFFDRVNNTLGIYQIPPLLHAAESCEPCVPPEPPPRISRLKLVYVRPIQIPSLASHKTKSRLNPRQKLG